MICTRCATLSPNKRRTKSARSEKGSHSFSPQVPCTATFSRASQELQPGSQNVPMLTNKPQAPPLLFLRFFVSLFLCFFLRLAYFYFYSVFDFLVFLFGWFLKFVSCLFFLYFVVVFVCRFPCPYVCSLISFLTYDLACLVFFVSCFLFSMSYFLFLTSCFLFAGEGSFRRRRGASTFGRVSFPQRSHT